ncbi:50S ribosomal protein L11 methyltransferase [Erythrobacter oryzae]|uniref:50S ribosomal protein L11 methyltransferase n=1 Tax=Erythrobacter oryzae TaxID=3019556 RepID=UPI002556096F|nr:50S ribosomal protein L11 methyltransferase [Erythrobacter sp. COR-2]
MTAKPTDHRQPLANPADFLATGLELAESQAGALAIALAERALAAHPGDPLWQAIAASVLRAGVPEFHIRMLHDRRRNAAYRAAIERMAPGRRVLDIGTGSGLLAMMAARAGAERVYACEENAMLAAAARKVIAANGLAERITVFDRHSGQLDRMRDLDGGVDLVVSEVFDHGVVGEGVLASLAHARAELAVPGALFLPEKASLMVALAEFAAPADSVGLVEGFDLSGFTPHLNPRRHVFADDPALALRSEPCALLDFDFGAGDPPISVSATAALVSTGGPVSGLAQWLHLTFAADITYENRPGSGADLHWAINLAPCAPHRSRPGDRYRAGAWYSDADLASWVEAVQPD